MLGPHGPHACACVCACECACVRAHVPTMRRGVARAQRGKVCVQHARRAWHAHALGVYIGVCGVCAHGTCSWIRLRACVRALMRVSTFACAHAGMCARVRVCAHQCVCAHVHVCGAVELVWGGAFAAEYCVRTHACSVHACVCGACACLCTHVHSWHAMWIGAHGGAGNLQCVLRVWCVRGVRGTCAACMHVHTCFCACVHVCTCMRACCVRACVRACVLALRTRS